MQRRELALLGQALGVQPIFLKAAWADDVLYGGTGQRIGGDLDVLVPNPHFRSFAEALLESGYKRVLVATHTMTAEYGDKEWVFKKPGASLPVDLHRDLSEHFPKATREFAQRSKLYRTDGDTILSLDEADQVLYCIMHYMGHHFLLDGRHLEDVSRLVASVKLDWEAIQVRTERLSACVPIALLVDALKNLGCECPEPAFFLRTPRLMRRYHWARSWIGTAHGLSRLEPHRTKMQFYVDALYRLPRLKGSLTEPIMVLAKYSFLRLADRLASLRNMSSLFGRGGKNKAGAEK